jgi:uncharacterized protein YndB with AHSA1/START domain
MNYKGKESKMSARKNSPGEQRAVPDMVLTRVLNAPRDLVFKVWTDAEQLAKWWGPKGFSNPVCEVGLHPGGAIRIHMRGPDGVVYPMTGVYQEIVAPERLVFASSALGENDQPLFEVLHTVTFAEEGHKTRLTVRAQVVKTTAAAAPHLKGQEEGWSQSLDRLDRLLNSKQEPEFVMTRSTHHGTFVIERAFAFARSVVFAAWADPVAKARWFTGPAQWRQLDREFDFRVGGHERLSGGPPGGRVSIFSSSYYDIVQDERIVYAYDMRLNEARISVSLATVEFKADGAATQLIVTEQGVFLDGYDDAGSREHGTRALLDQLDAVLRREAAGA